MPKMGIVFYNLESSCSKIENQTVMFYAYQLSGPPLDEREKNNAISASLFPGDHAKLTDLKGKSDAIALKWKLMWKKDYISAHLYDIVEVHIGKSNDQEINDTGVLPRLYIQCKSLNKFKDVK